MRVSSASEVWRDHRRWSNAANRLKRSIVCWRVVALALSVLGAVLATGAAQAGMGTAGARWANGCAAAALALVPVVRGAKLSRGAIESWTRARAASETLKTAVYLYCTRTPPYAGDDRDAELARAANAVLADVADLEFHALGSPDDDKPMPLVTDVTSYVRLRVEPQIDRYYRVSAARQLRRLRLFQGVEYALAVAAAAAGALAATTRSDGLAAWVPVITTIGAAITAHIAAARYQHLVIAYLATARQLRFLVGAWRSRGQFDATAGARLVRECEDVISRENESWMAAWTREESGTPPSEAR